MAELNDTRFELAILAVYEERLAQSFTTLAWELNLRDWA